MRKYGIASHIFNTNMENRKTECECTPFPDAVVGQVFAQHSAQYFWSQGEGAGSVLQQCYTFSSNFTSCSPDRSCTVLALLLS